MFNNKDFEIVKHGVETILKINYLGKQNFPSIEEDGIVMRDTIKRLIQNSSVTKIMFIHNKNYEYDFDQIRVLREIGDVYLKLSKDKNLFKKEEGVIREDSFMKIFFDRYAYIQNIIFKDLLSDCIGTYVRVKRKLRDYKFEIKYREEDFKAIDENYENALNHILSLLETTFIIKKLKGELDGHSIGDRKIYGKVFKANIKPNFIYTSLRKEIPYNSRQVDSYSLESSKVRVFNLDDKVFNLYHLTPKEFDLNEEKYNILNLAKEVISEHSPESSDFIEPEKLREVFFNISKDLITEIAEFKNVDLTDDEVSELSNILIKYTVGFGLVETLLEDEKVQDISINSPANKTPIFITHNEFEECSTNIILEEDEVEGFASRLRMLSGKPLDAANPLLDTEIETPKARARVSVIGKPLNPYGLGFSFRRHRDKPWTLPLFIKNKMISPLAAGVLSFIVDGSRTFLIAGTRGSGKSSFLTALMIEIMRKYRIITIEDSVYKNSKILVKYNNKTYNIEIEKFFNILKKENEVIKKEDREVIEDNFEINSMDFNGKIISGGATKMIRHKVKKDMFKIRTRSGREIKITQDHSIFTIGENVLYKEIKGSNLKLGDYIVTPNKLENNNKTKKYLDIIKIIEDENKLNSLINFFVKVKKVNLDIMNKYSNIYPKQTIRRWTKEKSFYIQMADLNQITHIKVGSNSHKFIETKILLDEDFLTFVGLWVADGCYDKNSIIMSVSSNEEKKLVKKIAKRFDLEVKIHSDKFSSMLNSKTLKYIFENFLELKGDAYTKKIPNWIFSLSKKQISYFLKGLFSGDGCATDYEIILSLASKKLLKDVQMALLQFNVLSSINLYKKKENKIYPDRTFDLRISGVKNHKNFLKIGFLQYYKNEKLKINSKRKINHENSNIIPLPISLKEKIGKLTPKHIFNKSDYIKRENHIGENKLKKVVSYLEKNKHFDLANTLKKLVDNDIFWDKVVFISKSSKEDFVYDVSVPKYENFVCENILAHNTLEIPTLDFTDLGYNIQPMSVKSALSLTKDGVSADQGIRSTLRLGDSCLIVGEVRSTEALALYEAMRVGALANTVCGTIHGDSPYGVYDRLVNDLGVPKTSFKATDLVIVANPIKSNDGLSRKRRVTQITEIRKKWENDPVLEDGFCDLLKYNPHTDMLEITDDLINGESEVLKSIASNVPQWAGNWSAVWDNIELRAKIKEYQVEKAKEIKNDDILEAKNVIEANDMFHKICQKILDNYNKLDSNLIYEEFCLWYDDFVKNLEL